MSVIEVDSERVIQAAGTAARSAATLGAEADALMRHLNALGDCWRGGAAQRFQSVIAEWEKVQKQVHESLGSIREALHAAGQQYSDVEAANTRMFG
ncbi:WXG100 family type VII secretion target [Brevibacterium sp. 5221]|uniref:ESAT-6-like protein n=1 Tax=Brevibacterium rongguiense TaxID=2695267 RepID=A0A6N9H9I7_9MICO|nr:MULTISPECIES: WXG100 family type VII secretion target [Brevibacterium]MYM20717.1 WXG100 family type VII secretion target [Brevibacterium rongguiense]WAL40040.1 WXG100 family type VII secretion target [Brevibacterium sp. BRM-1]